MPTDRRIVGPSKKENASFSPPLMSNEKLVQEPVHCRW